MSKVDLAKTLTERMIQLKLSKSQVAKDAGFSRQTLYKLLNADIDEARLSTIIKISQALQLHPTDLLRIYFKNISLENSHIKDNSGFLGDITYPDNSLVMANQQFTKVWSVKNTGKTTWRGRKLICVDQDIETTSFDSRININKQRGLRPLTRSIDIPDTQPMSTIQLSVEFLAPDYPCSTISYWKSIDNKGNYCFPEKEGLSCFVRVLKY